ncbi:putative non-LTR retroelement reverse transcriptase, partial [Trifolium medium]|nr:putative non-LTR retroelement reverse transcriptase [Trifolium medium]
MSPWKAPGPDGFPAGFYQKSWGIVGKSVCDFVKKVWNEPSVIASVNQTDICLIPKVDHPESVSQFRPISLCNAIYKVVSKVMVERLKVHIPKLVSPFQTDFVSGQNIHENIIIAQEMIHSMGKTKGRKGYFVIKVDLSKAYDKLSWGFIWRILNEINLPENMINVIMHSVTSVETNVKWHGARAEFFRPQRGIRQGDPISPYLFVLCMDKLSHLIMHEVDNGNWKAMKVGRNGPVVSHLMFADDLLLFGEATERQMNHTMEVLNKFCSMSGQEVSIEKTNIFFSKNVDRATRNKLVQRSGFRETLQLGKYLGVPITGKAPRREDYQYIIDQVSSRLVAWKANHLSFAGRVTLAKSVIEAIPIYPMMTNRIPKTCLEEIQKLQRKFIWGDTDERRKYHDVNWKIVTKPKCMGGLGLRRLETMNQACLAKVGWKLYTGADDMWCEVLRGKYNCHNFKDEGVSCASASSLWKNIIKLRPNLNNYCFWAIGNGADVEAWKDAWIDVGFRVADLDINIPGNLLHARVRDLVDNDGMWNWNLLNGWLPDNILKRINAILPPHEEKGSDFQLGTGTHNNKFSIASMYEILCEFNKLDDEKVWLDIWKLRITERNRYFMWLVKHNRLLTNQVKARMGLGNAVCDFCGEEETSLHVLRDCGLSMGVWLAIIPNNLRDIFFEGNLEAWFQVNIMADSYIEGQLHWKDVWATTCHCLWYWRNMENRNNHFMRPTNTAFHILKRVKEYYASSELNCVATQAQRVVSYIAWKPPDDGWVKLNTDGACIERSVAACGGVLRNSQGEWIGGFSKFLGTCSAYVAELWGLLEGLKYTWKLGFRKVELNVDSVAVVKVIKEGGTASNMGYSLVKEIRRHISFGWEVKISQSYREANRCADALANMGYSLDGNIVFFEVCPSQLVQLVVSDALGDFSPFDSSLVVFPSRAYALLV